MIFRRVAPIEKKFDWKTPCWSGPRWMSVAVASRMRPGGAVQFLVVKPVIPHNSAHPASVPEWNLRFLLHSHEPSQDTISWLCVTPRGSLRIHRGASGKERNKALAPFP